MADPLITSTVLAPWLENISRSPDLRVAHGYSGSLGLHPNAVGDNTGASSRYPLKVTSLITKSKVCKLSSGIGLEIFKEHILPRVEAAEHEVILVTCFWAASPTLDALATSLRRLSAKAIQQKRDGMRSEPIRVSICFSSRSLLQKLFHTSSLRGQRYSPAQWRFKLGLPRPEELQGLDLEVKSLFIRPLSVMHSKFVIIDRAIALLPSCNVSWEEWYEGCIELEGPIVLPLWQFWKGVWRLDEEEKEEEWPQQFNVLPSNATGHSSSEATTPSYAGGLDVTTVLLPSTHHADYRTSWPWSGLECPCTPLNSFLLAIFEHARSHIYLQTPNITSQSVLVSLMDCLRRGVDVTILSNQRMMVLEQLVTAGRTTHYCLKRLRADYAKLEHEFAARATDNSDVDVEQGTLMAAHPPGKLTIRYWVSKHPPKVSHLKLTVVDDEVCVLGSGNMDRASWFTSQELGIAFFSKELVQQVCAEFVDEEVEYHHEFPA